MQVFNILLGGSTAVISLQIWREAAMHFGSMLSSLSSTPDDSVPPLVRIERFFAKAEGRKCLSTTRKLEASDRMAVVTVDTSTHDRAPCTQPGLDRSLLIADFRLQDAVPFTANIVGHTAECGDVTETRAGVPMRAFRVVDAVGNYVHCVAFWRHAEDERLGDNCGCAVFRTRAGRP